MGRRKRGRKRRFDDDDGGIPITPMIDVVFLLLIYFIATLEPIPIFAHLNVYTPSSDAPPKEKPVDPPSLIRIEVHAEGYIFDGVPVSENQLDGFLGTLARASKTQSVLIMCSLSAPHGRLVKVLDFCAKHGLTNLSIMDAK
jgi:biopolymer transport protein ExbD